MKGGDGLRGRPRRYSLSLPTAQARRPPRDLPRVGQHRNLKTTFMLVSSWQLMFCYILLINGGTWYLLNDPTTERWAVLKKYRKNSQENNNNNKTPPPNLEIRRILTSRKGQDFSMLEASSVSSDLWFFPLVLDISDSVTIFTVLLQAYTYLNTTMGSFPGNSSHRCFKKKKKKRSFLFPMKTFNYSSSW